MLEISSRKENDIVTASVAGRVDSTNAAEFEKEVAAADTEASLVLDMEALEYISSAGLRVILKLRKRHPDIKIVNVSTDVYEIFDMTGFTDMMSIKRAYRRVSVEGCEVIGQGANGKVYRIDPDTVVKVYLNPDSLADIEHERDVARKALVLGIPTAISYDVVKVDDHYASMFEMLNAKSFAKLLKAHPENVDEYAAMYVELLKLIHSTEVPAGQLPDQKDVLLRWIADLKGHLPDDVHARLTRLSQDIPHDDHMIHGDYHAKNIMLQNDNEVMLIDMDTLAVGHPVLEFASIYNAYIGFHALNHDSILDFMGFDYETGVRLWKDTLRLYYGTEDESVLSYREKQAETVGLIRLLRRTIRRNGDPAFIDYCRNKLCSLAFALDTLT